MEVEVPCGGAYEAVNICGGAYGVVVAAAAVEGEGEAEVVVVVVTCDDAWGGAYNDGVAVQGFCRCMVSHKVEAVEVEVEVAEWGHKQEVGEVEVEVEEEVVVVVEEEVVGEVEVAEGSHIRLQGEVEVEAEEVVEVNYRHIPAWVVGEVEVNYRHIPVWAVGEVEVVEGEEVKAEVEVAAA